MPRRRGGKKIDFTHWTPFSGTFLAQGAGSAAVNVQAANHESETLLRTRGWLTAWMDGAPVTGAFALIAVGMLIVPDGSGTTVTVSPFAEGDSPWFWHEVFALGYEEFVTDVIQADVLSSVRIPIDSKAMRIIRNSEIQLVVENITIGGAATVNLSVVGRMLTGQ